MSRSGYLATTSARPIKRAGSVALVFLFLVVVLVGVAKAGSRVAEPEVRLSEDIDLGDDASNRTETDNFEIEQYAARYRVSVDEAHRLLELQDRAGLLQPLLEAGEPTGFAGMWIETGSPFSVTVLLTDGDEATISSYVEEVGLEGLVKTQAAKYSLRQLAKMHHSIRTLFPGSYDSSLDIKANSVEVMTLDSVRFLQGLASHGVDIPEDALVVTEVERLAEPATMYGGIHLGSPACTTGFSVRNNGSTLWGVTTAGHCGNTASYLGTNLPFQAEDTNGDDDVQWHTTPGIADDNWISIDADASREREIKGIVHRNNQPIGYSACKYGRTEGLYCGTVVRRDLAPGYLTNPLPVFMQLNPGVVDACSGGDSGGPEYKITTSPQANAVGMTTGCIGSGGDHDVMYMAANFIGGLGIVVLTS